MNRSKGAFFNPNGRRGTGKPRRKPVQREKAEQEQIKSLLISVGGKLYVLGTRRSRGRECPNCGTFVAEHQGTRQTPGVCDILVFLPKRGDWPRPFRLLFVEAKAVGADGRMGRPSDDQKVFRDLSFGAGIDHVLGDYTAVIQWLGVHGYVKPDNIPHYRRPPNGESESRDGTTGPDSGRRT